MRTRLALEALERAAWLVAALLADLPPTTIDGATLLVAWVRGIP